MFKNTKTWISWEWYIPFWWNKTILNLCLRLQILRNYHFVPFSGYSSFCIFKHTMIRYNNRWKTEAIKNRTLLDLSTICYIVDVSNKLNKNLSVISLELTGILSFLLSIVSDMETNVFTWLKMYTQISSLKLKWMASYLILSLLREKFSRGAYSLYIYTLLWLRYLPVSLIPKEG